MSITDIINHGLASLHPQTYGEKFRQAQVALERHTGPDKIRICKTTRMTRVEDMTAKEMTAELTRLRVKGRSKATTKEKKMKLLKRFLLGTPKLRTIQ